MPTSNFSISPAIEFRVRAGTASGVPGYAEGIRSADDIAGNWSVQKYKSPEQLVAYRTKAIRTLARHGMALFARAQSVLEDCNKSPDLRADDPGALDSRAFVEYRIGEVGAAIADCNAALLREPKPVSSLYIRAPPN